MRVDRFKTGERVRLNADLPVIGGPTWLVEGELRTAAIPAGTEGWVLRSHARSDLYAVRFPDWEVWVDDARLERAG